MKQFRRADLEDWYGKLDECQHTCVDCTDSLGGVCLNHALIACGARLDPAMGVRPDLV